MSVRVELVASAAAIATAPPCLILFAINVSMITKLKKSNFLYSQYKSIRVRVELVASASAMATAPLFSMLFAIKM